MECQENAVKLKEIYIYKIERNIEKINSRFID